MAKYILKRILYMLLVMFILSFLMYVIFSAIPFDRARVLADAQKNAFKNDPDGPAKLEALYQSYRVQLGLDKNVFERYLMWLGVMPLNGKFNGLLQGNLGTSYTAIQQPVLDAIKEPMKNTVFMNIFATILALGITIPLGIFCAVKKGSKRDTAVQIGTIIGYSMPTFITAILFIFLFAVVIPIFPVAGMGTSGADYTGFRAFLDKMYYLALPLIVMTFCSLGGMTRYVRASMIEALSMDCIRTARAKGLREKTVVYSHAWRNALVPIVTLVIGWFLSIFSGSMMIENIFGINGVGRFYIIALTENNFDVVLALQMFYVFIALLGNLFIDIAYGIVDPRIRIAK